jgi:hypothetical protein
MKKLSALLLIIGALTSCKTPNEMNGNSENKPGMFPPGFNRSQNSPGMFPGPGFKKKEKVEKTVTPNDNVEVKSNGGQSNDVTNNTAPLNENKTQPTENVSAITTANQDNQNSIKVIENNEKPNTVVENHPVIQNTDTLTNDKIIQLTKIQIPPETIILMIQKSYNIFDLSVDGLIKLGENGVDKTVLNEMNRSNSIK